MLQEISDDDLNNEFKQKILKLNDNESQLYHESYITNSSMVAFGQCPADILARTVKSDAEVFLHETRQYIGQTALLQNGNYFIEFIRQESDASDKNIKTGILRKTTEMGRDLWSHILNYHIKYDSRLTSKTESDEQ